MHTLMSTTPDVTDMTDVTDVTDALDALDALDASDVPEAFWSVQPIRVTTASVTEKSRGAARAHTTIARVLLGGVVLQLHEVFEAREIVQPGEFDVADRAVALFADE